MSRYTRNEIWNNVLGIGNLIIEELLVVADEPILFVCVDGKSEDRYLIMNYDSYESEFVISKIKPSTLSEMLENKITMAEAFRRASHILLTKKVGGEIHFEKYDPAEFSDDMLPERGTFFELDFDYIRRYVSVLKQIPQFVVDYNLPIKKTDHDRFVDYDFHCSDSPDVLLSKFSANVGGSTIMFNTAA